MVITRGRYWWYYPWEKKTENPPDYMAMVHPLAISTYECYYIRYMKLQRHYRTLLQTSANTDTSSTQMAVSKRIGGRGTLRRVTIGMWSDIGVCALESSCGGINPSILTGPTFGRSCGAGVSGGVSPSGLAGMMMDAASIGRRGFGANMGGDVAEVVNAGGSDMAVAVAASRE